MLEHANISVANTEATVAFLSAVFPHWKVRAHGEYQGQDRSWLHFGSDSCYIALEQNHTQGDAVSESSQPISHIGLVVEDLDAVSERVANVAGVKKGDPGEVTPYRRRNYWFDGSGLEWELIEYTTDDFSKRNA